MVAALTGVQAMSMATTTPGDRQFLGHPRGLAYLAFAEAWERFSFYGMQTLLVLYMGRQLLLPGHVEHIAGFGQFRAGIESVTGPLSATALGSAIFGLYAGGVYLTPILGGLVADRLLGRTRTIAIGAVVMAIGHFLMAFEVSFLAALACLLVGVGMFKGNIASQVGELYAPGDLRRADAFQIYMVGISLSAILSPLICGTLGEKVAWHWGFGAAGVGMLVGLAVYLKGRRWLPPDQVAPRARARAPKLARGEGLAIGVLIALIPILALCALGNQQMLNAYIVWGGDHYQLSFGGHRMPVTWLISLDALIATVVLVGSVMFWRWWARRRREPDEIFKLAIGAGISALAPLVLVAASLHGAATGQKIGLAWAVGYHIVNEIGFANLFPVGLALFSRASPRAVAGSMIGVYYLNLVFANFAVGWLGGFVEAMPSVQFWLLHAGLVAAGAVLLVIFGKLFGRVLAPTVDPEATA